jgi:hypothetical protein
MRHLKVLGVALVAMFALSVTALGMTAASASAELALPDISLLTGETTFPLYLNFADNGETPTKLETSAGAQLEGKGVSTLLELTALGKLGPFKANFLNVTNPEKGEKCNTTGDAAGEVLITGEWHLVPINTSPLEHGIAFLLGSLVLITCGTKKIDVKGCALADILVTENNVDLTEVKGSLASDGKGKDLKREYLNDLPQFVKCTLESEVVGTGIKREAAEVVNEGKEIPFTIETGSSAKMFLFTGL